MVSFKQGDLIWIDFDPQAGHEQKSRRPAIVVSKTNFNRQNAFTMVCPITTTARNHPTELKLPDGLGVSGTILCDQARFLDLNSRNATLIEPAPRGVIQAASDLIVGFIEIG